MAASASSSTASPPHYSDISLPLDLDTAAAVQAQDALGQLCMRALQALPVEVVRMKAGITNIVLRMQVNRSTLLARIYGRNTEVIIDRKAELENHTLMHQHGLAPPIYATFANGYLYGFVPGTPTAPSELQLPSIFPLVARRLADVHRLPVPADKPTSPTIFPSLRRFHKLVQDTVVTLPDLAARLKAALHWDEVGQDVEQLAAVAESLVPLTTVVYSHNDLLAGNVIVAPDGSKVDFIDFEYAGPNYRGYDIGNHFNEQCGLEVVDYSLYPSPDLQRAWCRDYLAAYAQPSPAAVAESEVLKLYHEVQLFALASHLFWGIWSFVQAACSTIDFDYFGYGLIRLAEFRRRRDEVVREARKVLAMEPSVG